LEGVNHAKSSGIAAPIAKAIAEAIAASIGLAA
jgi:hypothetical protein